MSFTANSTGGTYRHNHNQGDLRAAIGAVNYDSSKIGYVASHVSPYGGKTTSSYILQCTLSTGLGNVPFNHHTPIYGYTSTESNVYPYITVYFWRRTA